METSEVKRGQIVALVESGRKMKDVASFLSVSPQLVSLTMKRYRETGVFTSKPRTGRPIVTTEKDDKMIKRAVVVNPNASSMSIASSLPTRVSARTVRRRLNVKFGLKAYRPAKKPLLSKKNLRDRVIFCKKYQHFTAEMWEDVLWSDESNIRMFDCGFKYVRRPAGERFSSKYCQKTVKHAPYWMVWGSCSGKGRGNLFFLPQNQTMNAQQYEKVLQERLKPMMEIHGCALFMHDGAPCHQAKKIKSWLVSEGINVLGPWPGQSPDLNPIENLWNIVKTKVGNIKPTSLPQLREAILKVWCTEIDPALCKKLVHSMPARIAAVLKNKGGYCKY